MSNKLEQAEQEFILKLQATKTGLKNTEITEFTSTLTDDERAQLVNKILQSGNAEILTITGTDGWILRYRKSNLPAGSTPEEQVVYSLIEEADKSGIWVKDIREKSGLNDNQLRRILKAMEQKKLVKSIKAVGTTKKSYILFEVDADDELTGGTFYVDQQFDSQFVQTLIQVCASLLQTRYNEALEKYPNDLAAQTRMACMNGQEVAKYIHERGISKVQLTVPNVESVLDTAVLDGKLEKRSDRSYRWVNRPIVITPLVSMPCFFCPMRSECRPGHRISPENCEYLKKSFEL